MPVWIFKLLLVLLLLFIVINLGFALFKMVSTTHSAQSKSMSHYLGRRVMLSICVVVLLLIALSLGWITPNPRPY
jgi:putative copper export protein